MHNLLQDAERDRLVAPLTGMLAGSVTLGGRLHRAVRESEGSDFHSLAASAATAELLLQPGLRGAHGALADALLDFAMAMAEATPPSRSAVAGSLVLRREDPSDFVLLTPFHRLSGNLARGELRQQPRSPGGPVVLHGGNLVEFRIGRRHGCVDVEDSIADCALEAGTERAVLRHVSVVRGKAGLLAPREVEAGRLEMAYEIRADSPVLRLAVTFTATRRLRGVRLTTALDALGQGGLEAGAAMLRESGAWREALAPASPGNAHWDAGAPVFHLALGRAGWPAAAPVLHLRPLAPERVASVTVRAERAGAVHWLLLRHGPADLEAGEAITVREDRLLAPHGAVEPVAAGMAAGLPGLDLDPAPRPAAALQAVAAALMLDAAGAWREGLPEARRKALLGFAQRQLAALGATSGTAALAQGAVAADSLRRAGVAGMAGVQARLVGMLAEAGPQGLGTQALVMLGLARAAAWPDSAASAAALAALLPAVTLTDAAEPEDVALLARAAGAVALAAEAGTALPDEAVGHARSLHRAAINRLRPLARPRGEVLLVGPQGAPAAEAQALLALALLAPDGLAFGMKRHAAGAPA